MNYQSLIENFNLPPLRRKVFSPAILSTVYENYTDLYVITKKWANRMGSSLGVHERILAIL
jgi:hypothetical protein